MLITGAAGFVGRHVVQLLGDRHDVEVHAVSRTPGTDVRAQWHTVDLLKSGAPEQLVQSVRPTHLLHLAWYTEHPLYWNSPANIPWTSASLDLIRAFQAAGGERAVFAGTCAEYDLHAASGPCREDATTERPASLYGASKLAVGRVAQAFSVATGFEFAWGRLFYLFGPDEPVTRLVPSTVSALLRGERTTCKHGDYLRDYLYVRDAAAALVALLQSRVTGPVNIGSGAAVALAELARLVGSRVGRPDLIDIRARSTAGSEPVSVVAEVVRLADEVGWKPAYSLIAGIDETVDWWKSLPRR